MTKRPKQKPTDEELEEFGQWALWAFRQPNALQLFRESGARCSHGPLCETCLEEGRTQVSRILASQGDVEA